ncbi:RdgB/HAM1 family non-canonical purine NTP pyrophosphatase [Herbiconiux sp. CPCC 203407]|uniref:dITP/XTP pyrophosphatase n=1 Tax=Herbiconiux oxytropis TaxID=2970915 RepID=A0AA41XDJ4_9MICO|nr:RdgB/HAM1 family non-canonical purine NTP pyrophosphatase [Herbiconiux oxytropis]MCS5721327.1 RdgB/HAM1 family non-canonical purine NTP pyrophosphatase [Herbiconiux oxytropis]MCS5726234.1 RdgB/HAM1 family non-canonical purine NTP pyrophosphatase [Herbiconiux oxytropis]
MRVVLATHNAHKVEEFQAILGSVLPELEIVAYDGPEPVEDGTSFAENALIKARTAAHHTGLPALADDSGICVDVMNGSPGIFSALWAGHGKGAEANLALLLDQMADIAPEHRGAHFACTIALVVPASGAEHVVEGIWPGALATEAHGGGGFGYDPIFVPVGHEVTAAELTAAEKNAISHRGRAFEAAIPLLRTTLIPD